MAIHIQNRRYQDNSTGKKILDLPAGGYNNHWNRNVITNADKSKIYITVGSGSNVGENGLENEVRKANILEVMQMEPEKKFMPVGFVTLLVWIGHQYPLDSHR